MASIRAKFMIRCEPSPSDSKTNEPHLIWVQLLEEDDEEKFAFPDAYKDVSHHDALFTLPPAIDAKRNLLPRWTARIFKVKLPANIAALYYDDSGNAKFMGTMLNLFHPADLLQPLKSTTRSELPAPAAFVAATPAQRSLSSIVKDAILTKFNTKSLTNAEAWINIFEKECTRLGITNDKFWEVFRLFLEDTAETWYNTTRLSSGSTSWTFWRESFLEVFGVQGLSSARTAFTYRYLGGSLSDYAQNKLSLLTSFNLAMHELDKIVHVTFGLLQNLHDRINLKEITTVGKLLMLINTFDKPIVPHSISGSSNASFSSPSSSTPPPNAFSSLRSRTPCAYCKKSRGRDLYHAEKDCLNKTRDAQRKPSAPKLDNPPKAIHSFELDNMQREILDLSKNEWGPRLSR